MVYRSQPSVQNVQRRGLTDRISGAAHNPEQNPEGGRP